MSEKKRPVKSFRVGCVVASFWENSSSEGEPFQSVTFERMYKCAGDDRWSYSSSFGPRQLLELSKAADLAHSALLEDDEVESAA